MDDIKRLIRDRPSTRTLDWVCAAVGARSRLDSWMVAPGGGACAIHAVDVLDAGGVRHPLVLKRFFREDWLAEEPDVAEREARHLRLLEGVSLPIPKLVAVDPYAEVCDRPAILMTRLPGRVVLMPDGIGGMEAWLRDLAETLRVLHEIPDDVAREFPPYRHYGDPDALPIPAWTKRPDVWEAVAARLREPAPACTSRFVHRDYHPCNLLWKRGEISGVLDFTDSSYGPAPVDLAHCRFNLAQLHGPDVADRFLEVYDALAPGAARLDPYWDFVGFLNTLPGPAGVYWGWRNLGVRHLTAETCWARLDEYAARCVAALT